MAEAKDVGEALAAYEPQTPAYLALKAKLAELRAGKARCRPRLRFQTGRCSRSAWPMRAFRTCASGSASPATATFDKALADAVKKFQQEHELKATGLLTPTSVEALNGRQPDRPIDTSSPIWNAGDGCRTISARLTSWSIFPITRCASFKTSDSSG